MSPADALTPLAAQLDLSGTAHEIGAQTEAMRLFAPAPAQLAGQTYLAGIADTNEPEGNEQ